MGIEHVVEEIWKKNWEIVRVSDAYRKGMTLKEAKPMLRILFEAAMVDLLKKVENSTARPTTPLLVSFRMEGEEVVAECEGVEARGNSMVGALQNLTALLADEGKVSVSDEGEMDVRLSLRKLRAVASYFGFPLAAFFLPDSALKEFERKTLEEDVRKKLEKLDRIREILEED